MMNKKHKIMKTKYLFGLTTLSLMIVSCNYRMEDVDKSIPLGDMTFYANWGESEASKTTVYNENEILWTPGDAIDVFYGNLSSGKFTSNTQKAAAYTQFVGSLSIVSGTIETGNEAHSFWAIYPHDANNSCDDKSVTLTVAEKQKGANGTFAPKTFPAIAKSSGLDLAFYNVCGGVVFTVTRDDIKSVTLSGINNEDIAGSIRTAFIDGLPAVQEVISGVKSISLTAPDNKTFTPGTKYYITVLPVTFSKGYQLTFKNSSGAEGTKTVSMSKTINRSRFLVVNDADEGVTFSGGESETTFIQFADDNVRSKLVAAFDTNGDGELSLAEAASVKSAESIKAAFSSDNNYTSFEEFQFFTGITNLSASMFANWTSLTSIVLPETIALVGDRAFENCCNLSSIDIPNTVKNIGQNAFSDCTRLISVNLPDKLEKIDFYLFNNCSSLLSIVIPPHVSLIRSAAFWNCTNLKTITIPNSVTSIEGAAFSLCKSVSHLYIDDLSVINSFSNASPLGSTNQSVHLYVKGVEVTDISIPKEITIIPEQAFYHCAFLKSVIIHEGVSRIEVSAFSGCTSLSSLVLSEGLSKIEDLAFSDCANLPSLKLPKSLYSIGRNAFSNCTKLSSVDLNEGLSSIGIYAFSNCTNLSSVSIPSTISSIEEGVFNECERLSSVLIPEGITTIGEKSFYRCYDLTSIDLPKSVSNIGDLAFCFCSSLLSITIRASSVPVGGSNMFYLTGTCPIFVPAESIDSYKTANHWKTYADRIQAIPGTGTNAYVDLGLSVKWATCNLGASSPEEYGDYYAWGETSVKSEYTLQNYVFYNGGHEEADVLLSKYNSSKDHGTVDKKTRLEKEDDVAYVKLGGNWRMPTKDEINELRYECTWEWTSLNGVKGYIITSKSNGNSIFLPAAGYISPIGKESVGVIGWYWSSTHDYSINSYHLRFSSSYYDCAPIGPRYFGQTVRPVLE